MVFAGVGSRVAGRICVYFYSLMTKVEVDIETIIYHTERSFNTQVSLQYILSFIDRDIADVLELELVLVKLEADPEIVVKVEVEMEVKVEVEVKEIPVACLYVDWIFVKLGKDDEFNDGLYLG